MAMRPYAARTSFQFLFSSFEFAISIFQGQLNFVIGRSPGKCFPAARADILSLTRGLPYFDLSGLEFPFSSF
jgi:hypothetical protein